MAIFELDLCIYNTISRGNEYHLAYSNINFSIYEIKKKYRTMCRIKIKWRQCPFSFLPRLNNLGQANFFMSLSTFNTMIKKLLYTYMA